MIIPFAGFGCESAERGEPGSLGVEPPVDQGRGVGGSSPPWSLRLSRQSDSATVAPMRLLLVEDHASVIVVRGPTDAALLEVWDSGPAIPDAEAHARALGRQLSAYNSPQGRVCFSISEQPGGSWMR